MHEVAQAAARDSRVAYVEVDPVAIAHSKVILAGDDQTAIIDADLREPEKILTHPATGQMIDFSQPVGLLLVAVLHFIADAEDPVSLWRPDSPADVPEDPSRYGNLVGVAQKTS